MISHTVEYTLRAIVTIAQQQGQPCTAQQISQIAHVPAPYLSKLMQGLVRAGLVRSQRGKHGGFVMTNPPAELTLWDVIDAVEPIRRISECPREDKTHRSAFCSLHRRLNAVLATAEEQLRSTTIAEILAGLGSRAAHCQLRKLPERPAGAAAQMRAAATASQPGPRAKRAARRGGRPES